MVWLSSRAGTLSAEQRARKLLLSHLTPEQQRDYKKLGGFTVKTHGDEFLLKPDYTVRVSDGARLCAVVPELPLADQLLVRKLYLETDPDAFLRAANNLSQANPYYTYPYAPNDDTTALLRRARAYFADHGFVPERLTIDMRHRNDMHATELRVSYGTLSISYTIVDEHLAFGNMDVIFDSVIEQLCDQLTRACIKECGR